MDYNVPKHHIKQAVCATRLPYREGRHPKAVKVYTVNNESRYLLVQGVPSVGAISSLVALLSKYGPLEEHHALDEYPCQDKYTEVYLFKYKKIQSARFAKKKLDDYSFFGGILHVCYAPEYETVQETREKLLDRRRIVGFKIRQHAQLERLPPGRPMSNESRTNTEERMEDATTGDEPSLSKTSLLHEHRSHLVGRASFQPQTPSNGHISSSHPSFQPQTPNNGHISSSHPRNPSHQLPSQTGYRQPQTFASRVDSRLPYTAICKEPVDSASDQQWPQHTFELPEPPKAHPVWSRGAKPSKGHGRYHSLRVPSSHATLPAGYDGRLNPNLSPVSSLVSENSEANVRQNTARDKDPLQLIPRQASVKNSPVIVRNYKKAGPPPRFVPRQAMKRKSEEVSFELNNTSTKDKAPKQDPFDRELRQNAYKLGRLQGPQNLEAKKSVQVLPSLEKSMTNTIQSIRSKISQVISSSVKKSS